MIMNTCGSVHSIGIALFLSCLVFSCTNPQEEESDLGTTQGGSLLDLEVSDSQMSLDLGVDQYLDQEDMLSTYMIDASVDMTLEDLNPSDEGFSDQSLIDPDQGESTPVDFDDLLTTPCGEVFRVTSADQTCGECLPHFVEEEGTCVPQIECDSVGCSYPELFIFVSSYDVSEEGDGSPHAPFTSLRRALTAAQELPPRVIILGDGDYVGPFTIMTQTSVFGGYRYDGTNYFWERDESVRPKLMVTRPSDRLGRIVLLKIDRVLQPLTLSHINLIIEESADDHKSVYGLHLFGSEIYANHLNIFTLSGGNGQQGRQGSDGQSGDQGLSAEDLSNYSLCDLRLGAGSGGNNPSCPQSSGGEGGVHIQLIPNAPYIVSPSPSLGGACASGLNYMLSPVCDGAHGQPGQLGQSGTWSNGLASPLGEDFLWQESAGRGLPGTRGGHGTGGGGHQGPFFEELLAGGAGGGGGAGGCGGEGGQGGQGGGGSFGIFAVESRITIDTLAMRIGSGGRGGAGGRGGRGGAGLQGGGSLYCSQFSETVFDDETTSCNGVCMSDETLRGGTGGGGGQGGDGGQGSDGPSVGIWCSDGSELALRNPPQISVGVGAPSSDIFCVNQILEY